VLDVLSTRTADTAAVTEWIIERGRPVVVAADVEPMPSTVEKIRRSFSAAGWIPERDLPVDEKQHRTREEGYDNDHERDALAAAFHAFDDYEDTFERIAGKVPPRIESGAVIARVVASEESVEAVLDDLADDDGTEESEETHEPRELTAEEQRIKDLETRVERLDAHVDDLEATIEEKEETIAEYERELSDARREERREARERREVDRLERENEQLERKLDEQREETEQVEAKLDRLKELWRVDHSNFADVAEKRQGLVPVKPVAKFTTSALRAADERWELAPGDVVYLRDASGAGRSTAETLVEREPRLVLKSGGLSEVAREILFENEIPTAPAEEVTIEELDDLAVARESDVEDAIDGWRDRADERRKSQTGEMVDKLISEHRADRGESD
jgi:predicted RNase H-like nuclease (RuvC/YqgF family)